MRPINLTPHNIRLIASDGCDVVDIEPSGNVARVSTRTTKVEPLCLAGQLIDMKISSLGEVEDLPEPKANVVLIVSQMVARAAGRSDVVFPNDVVRDGAGMPVGCRSLARVVQ